MSATEAIPDGDAARAEARRALEICNACRYCEGYCAVFPAMTRRRAFADGDLDHLANLCHNCRGCYYACQYAPPHEFALNLPRALADVRQQSWADYAWPGFLARAFRDRGAGLAAVLVLGVAAMLWLAGAATGDGAGFYAIISHQAMIAVFAPVFLFALAAMAVGAVRYWRATRGIGAAPAHGLHHAMNLTNLGGGAAEGCNFEDEDRFTQGRRHFHQATLWGFLLCFAATAAGTVLHYGFDAPAPYGLISLPKLFGVPGGILLVIGTGGLLWLKRRADPELGVSRGAGGETVFTALLLLTGLTGLALYALRETAAMPALLVLHLGAVLALFLALPYTKMVHGLYRTLALIRDEGEKRRAGP